LKRQNDEKRMIETVSEKSLETEEALTEDVAVEADVATEIIIMEGIDPLTTTATPHRWRARMGAKLTAAEADSPTSAEEDMEEQTRICATSATSRGSLGTNVA
jgi:hypothetical protein